MKVKAQAPKPVEEDPATKAQRLAAEKAAQDAADSSISNTLERKTRLKARVYGTPAGASGASGSATPATAVTAATAQGAAQAAGYNYLQSSAGIRFF